MPDKTTVDHDALLQQLLKLESTDAQQGQQIASLDRKVDTGFQAQDRQFDELKHGLHALRRDTSQPINWGWVFAGLFGVCTLLLAFGEVLIKPGAKDVEHLGTRQLAAEERNQVAHAQLADRIDSSEARLVAYIDSANERFASRFNEHVVELKQRESWMRDQNEKNAGQHASHEARLNQNSHDIQSLVKLMDRQMELGTRSVEHRARMDERITGLQGIVALLREQSENDRDQLDEMLQREMRLINDTTRADLANLDARLQREMIDKLIPQQVQIDSLMDRVTYIERTRVSSPTPTSLKGPE